MLARVASRKPEACPIVAAVVTAYRIRSIAVIDRAVTGLQVALARAELPARVKLGELKARLEPATEWATRPQSAT